MFIKYVHHNFHYFHKLRLKWFHFRRVHITQATLDYLGGEYEVEPGNGATRNQYLRDHCVTTYFIVPPARRRKVDVCLIMNFNTKTLIELQSFFTIFFA